MFLEVATEPDAIPLFDRGVEFMAAVLLGEIKSAVPVPARASRQSTEKSSKELFIGINDARDIVSRDIPMVQSHLEPILSYMDPATGLKKKRNINGVIMIKPVAEAE